MRITCNPLAGPSRAPWDMKRMILMHKWHEFMFVQNISRCSQGPLKGVASFSHYLYEEEQISYRNWACSFLVWNPLHSSLYENHTEKILSCPWEDCKFHQKCILQPHSYLSQPQLWPLLLIWEFRKRITCKPLAGHLSSPCDKREWSWCTCDVIYFCWEYLKVFARCPHGCCKGIASYSHKLYENCEG